MIEFGTSVDRALGRGTLLSTFQAVSQALRRFSGAMEISRGMSAVLGA